MRDTLRVWKLDSLCAALLLLAAAIGCGDGVGGLFGEHGDGGETVVDPAGSITVTNPNGGETWPGGGSAVVTWTTTGTVGNVMIQLSADGGSSWITLVGNTVNDGSESIAVPLSPSTRCRVKVGELDGSPSDTSDADFVMVEWFTGEYVVIDLPTGSAASHGNIADLLTNGEYKTSKLVLRRIEAGTFEMGNETGATADYWELPKHTVNITKPFYLGVFEVSQRQWYEVMGTWPSYFTTTPDMRPVESVSWDSCQDFATQLSSETGRELRLPTEAEWEYACRAGTSMKYSFGDAVDGAYIWYRDNSGDETHEVGTKQPNPWGLYDMHGNVGEWCSDWYDGDYYLLSPRDDPQGPVYGNGRSVRGGDYFSHEDLCRCASRGGLDPAAAGRNVGFRILLPAP